MSSLQGSLGGAFLDAVPIIDGMYRQEPRRISDDQLSLTDLWQNSAPQEKQSKFQQLLRAGTQLVIYKSEGTLQAPPPVTDTWAEHWIVQLERHYILDGRNDLIKLLREQRDLPGLLLDAVPQLRQWFGDRLLQLQVSADEEDITARASVVWPGDLERAEAALRAFDQNWWLTNCAKSNGYLVFDFELVDGV